ncbi:MAG: ATPase P [Anaerolineae bacterium]
MIEITIPGDGSLRLSYLVMDYNGTLACNGVLLDGVAERLTELSKHLSLYVLTADTFGTARAVLADLPCTVHILPQVGQDHAKMAFVSQLGRTEAVCIGNGRNDKLMLQAAALGIAIVGPEGAATDAVLAADIVVPNIQVALDLLLHPLRLVATLRS